MESLVLVTDATSFVSSHIIQQLQESGYQVRATVVSLQDEEEKLKVLHDMCPEAKYKVEVVEADPAKADSWESAMKDVQFVIHTVKPQAAQPAAQEGEAQIQPSVDAVTNLCKASVASKSVKRIVLTSSYQAICGAPTAVTDKVFTEADWADADTADPLIKSVILAEKAAWDFVKELTDADKIDLCVLNPSLPLGPPLIEPQGDVVRMLMEGGIRGCPRVCYSLVDVRDLAAANVKALTLESAAGNRHIIHGSNLWMKDIALALSKEFKPQGYSVPTLSLPSVALWGLSLFNKTAKTFLPVVGKQSQLDNTRMKDVLGITPKDVKDTIVEEAKVLIEKGLVKKPKKVKNQGGASAAAGAEGDSKLEEEGEKREEKAEDKPKENGDVKEEEGGKKESLENSGAGKEEATENKADGGEEAAEAETSEEKVEMQAASAEKEKAASGDTAAVEDKADK